MQIIWSKYFLRIMFNKLVIEIAVTCYIFKIMAHERKF